MSARVNWRAAPALNRYRMAGFMRIRGNAVDSLKQPSKEAVRQWMRKKLAERRPPPDPQQIRRELGWDLVKVDPEAKRR